MFSAPPVIFYELEFIFVWSSHVALYTVFIFCPSIGFSLMTRPSFIIAAMDSPTVSSCQLSRDTVPTHVTPINFKVVAVQVVVTLSVELRP